MNKEIDIEDLFKYHKPDNDQIDRYDVIREEALELADVILFNTPQGEDQDAAIRKLRECVMFANASIALRGKR